MKKIAIIGSSGGNLYMQGGNDPRALLGEIFTQARSAGIEVGFVSFVGAKRTMDGISMDAPACLWSLSGDSVACGEEKKLSEINADAAASDAALAADLGRLGTAAPMLDLFSMRHETQYTRLFRS